MFSIATWLPREAKAQGDEIFQHRYIGLESGLSSLHVFGGLQDSRGFMWFATDNGLNRYDGNSMKVYDKSNGLRSNFVAKIAVDGQKRIWLLYGKDVGAFLQSSAAATAPLMARNTIFWDNTQLATSRNFQTVGVNSVVNASFSDLQAPTVADNEAGTGSIVNGGGNISADPLFVNPGTGNFELQNGSPCIDAGTATGAPAVDYLGNARPQGNGIDIGAYENGVPRPIVARDIHTDEAPFGVTVFPNPSLGKFTLSFDRELTGTVQLFDLQGRLAATQAFNGSNQVQFDLTAAASGAYLVRIISGNDVVTRQVLVKKP